jgi:hypothetical protein
MSESRDSAETPSRPIGVMERSRFQRLQSLEDAIAYRRARVSAPCADCGPEASGRRCDEHARDLELITEYQQTIQQSILTGPAADERACVQRR